MTIIALEERVLALETENKTLASDKETMSEKIRSLVRELEGNNRIRASAEADAKL